MQHPYKYISISIFIVDCGEGDIEEVEDCNTQGCPGRQIDRHTDRQKKTDRQTGIETDRQMDRHIYFFLMENHLKSQTDTQKDKQTSEHR